jgi:hypothetical protein
MVSGVDPPAFSLRAGDGVAAGMTETELPATGEARQDPAMAEISADFFTAADFAVAAPVA